MQRCTGSCVQNRPYTTPLGNPCEKHNMGPCLQITGKKLTGCWDLSHPFSLREGRQN